MSFARLLTSAFHRLDLIPTNPRDDLTDQERHDLVRSKRRLWNLIVGPMTLCMGRILVPMETKVNALLQARDGHLLKIRLLRPKGGEKEKPIVLLVHGGGWVFGTLDSYEGFARTLAQDADAVVVLVDYRLAPEYQFPFALDDSEDAMKWVWSNPLQLKRIGGSPAKGLVLCGDSAGGQICAVLAVLAKNAQIKVDLQALLYPAISCGGKQLWQHRIPAIEDSCYTPSMLENASGPILTLKGIEFCWNSYVQNIKMEEMNPLISPILFTRDDLLGVAGAYIVTCQKDVLRDEGIAYVEKLRNCGVTVKHDHYERAVHAFMTMFLVEQQDIAMIRLGRVIRNAFVSIE